MDLVIRGGTLLDGTGGAPRVADVAVKEGRIAQIGSVKANGPEIDATGLAVAPGFIDIHSHSDYTLLVDPRAVSALMQGVTTEVTGDQRSNLVDGPRSHQAGRWQSHTDCGFE